MTSHFQSWLILHNRIWINSMLLTYQKLLIQTAVTVSIEVTTGTLIDFWYCCSVGYSGSDFIAFRISLWFALPKGIFVLVCYRKNKQEYCGALMTRHFFCVSFQELNPTFSGAMILHYTVTVLYGEGLKKTHHKCFSKSNVNGKNSIALYFCRKKPIPKDCFIT